ncbi:hypothetical protein [Mitsuaria sp. GD03876]|uniref:hypothetical protein n=1 Tax=Mitsuaria sp. GD03876 TaxID=2975399 RepID=UPI00244A07C0|nr:hypothetical protein [Mitsuaria sp. GD03876]MDH0863539.1 hypothetical protein [Mitsuaria sp. GD03876]
MIDPTDYAAVFGGLPVPAPLQALMRFQNERGDEPYSSALRLARCDRAGLARGWCSDQEFLSRLIPIARAGASASFYALWDPDPSREPAPERWPVVAFGEEGGEWVVARDVRELLRLSSCDLAPRIDFDRVHYDRSEHHHRKSAGLEAYVDWLRVQQQLAPVEDADPILKAAQLQWQSDFEAWIHRFLQG